ncbi:hypothetical protein Tco_0743655, partial [Tanacetum coccineum]
LRFSMDDQNITMVEYIRLQTKKAQKNGQTFNWRTATYRKVYYEDFNSFTNFEADFPAIVYNDALTSNKNVLSEPTFGIPFDPKRYYKDGVYTKILQRPSKFEFDDMAPLPPRAQRHIWLRYQVEGYTKDIVYSFEQRLDTIFSRQELFTSPAWRRLFKIRGPLVREFILEFFSTCKMSDTVMGLDIADTLCFQLGGARRDGFQTYWFGNARAIPDKGGLRDYWAEISFDIDFLGLAPSYIYIRDIVRRMCHRWISCNISGRGQAPEKVIGLTVISRESLMIDIDELFKVNISVRIRDTWAWVASGPERQQGAAAGAQEGAEGAHVEIEGDQSRFATWMISCMTQLIDATGRTYQAFDTTLVSSSQMTYQRRTRRRTSKWGEECADMFSLVRYLDDQLHECQSNRGYTG